MSTHVSPPQRRKFLYTMLGGLGALIGAASAWPVFRFLSPLGSTQAAARRWLSHAVRLCPVRPIFSSIRASRRFFCSRLRANLLPCRRFVPISAALSPGRNRPESFSAPVMADVSLRKGRSLAAHHQNHLKALAVELDGDQLKVG